jgi:hypothetical protein
MSAGLSPQDATLLASDNVRSSIIAKAGALTVANNVNPPGIAVISDGQISYIRARIGTAPTGAAINLRINQLNAGIVADPSGYIASMPMANGDYLPIKVSKAPGSGARIVTCTRSVVGTADTPGTVLVTGTDITGAVQTETLTPGADTVLVSGTKFFATVNQFTQSGWTIAQTADNIVFGWGLQSVVALLSIAIAGTSGLASLLAPILVASGDVFTVDVTQIGSGTAGSDLAIDIAG